MGAKLSKCWDAIKRPEKNQTATGFQPLSIIELMKPGCLKPKKKIKKKSHEEHREKKKLTLEECLLASPGSNFKKRSGDDEQFHVFKHFLKRVHHPPRNFKYGAHRTGKMCNSKDRNLLKKSKKNKRVRFRLPEEADIMIFCYSSDEISQPA